MKSNALDNAFRTTLLYIDDYSDRVLVGRFSNSYYEDGTSFKSTIDFLMKMEAMLEEMRWPQAFSIRRTFQTVEEKITFDSSGNNIKEGALATFSLRVLFRQNASWQGSIYWHEKKQEESFRSVLELLTLIDSALIQEKE